MHAVGIALAMLAAVLLSGVLARLLPLPLPLIQIALGFLISAVFEQGVQLEPDIFFLLFLPPLLFLDGWRIPKESLFREKLGIVQLAFGLVLLTVAGLGYLLHWMIPAMPLPVAFALAAIVSPTDPVAISAITRRSPLPRRIASILEGESLFNDVSGLVAFRFAVAAALTGTFSLSMAAASFLWTALAGLAIGVGVVLLVNYAKNWFTRRFGEEPGSEVLVSLLTPFAAYVVAEHVEASGILSAVAAGVAMSYAELSGGALAVTRVNRKVIWDMLQFTLNGIMFVLLGEQFPAILDGAVTVVQEAGHHEVWWLAIYVSVICLALIVIRYAWVYASLRISHVYESRKRRDATPVSRRMILVLALAGARGAITMAGVMTLPLALPDGSAFPARDLAIFLAAMVIITSLLVASIALPALLRGLEQPVETRRHRQEDLVKRMAHDAAVKSVGQTLNELLESSSAPDAAVYTDAANRVLADLRDHHDEPDGQADLQEYRRRREAERRMRLAAISASRQAIFDLARTHRISDELAREQVQLLDLQEVRLNH
ncbi:Na+/H+ antiporter [Pusillimonas caeni]|uniref:Na+/H+ antiporter n=1 Tax=Pusillimonas caeni TaxID=1348472 RepID=UPI000E59A299|nr:Na+/H+ antiporter [Pusillimonas caeni]TFL15592.1 Na+/H+ antiporter [Pusillimonas caeni]